MGQDREIRPGGLSTLIQSRLRATAVAHPNIAFIKYWGNRDDALRLPSNGSISMTLGGLRTRTTVEFRRDLEADTLRLNGQPSGADALRRVGEHLNLIRALADTRLRAEVISENDFPTGAGIASSSSAFAALTTAAAAALKLDLDERRLSAIARRGSGSACRSIPGGYVEWHAGEADEDSFAESIARPGEWDLIDCIAIVSTAHKAITSFAGQARAASSMLQPARVADAERRLDVCRTAIRLRDFPALAGILEEDALLMHAVMLTSRPPLVYWEPATLAIVRAVTGWSGKGLAVAYTIDAGPNVHCIGPADSADEVERRLRALPGVLDVLRSRAGPGAALTNPDQGVRR